MSPNGCTLSLGLGFQIYKEGFDNWAKFIFSPTPVINHSNLHRSFLYAMSRTTFIDLPRSATVSLVAIVLAIIGFFLVGVFHKTNFLL